MIETLGRPSHRPSWAEVDLQAVRENVRLVRRRVGPKPEIMTVVKAQGYGHGMLPVARAMLEGGAQSLAIATADEGLCLRETEGFEKLSLLIMGPTLPDEAEAIQKADLAFSVGGNELLREHLKVARRRDKPARIHIQVDSGIGRDGYRFDDLSFLEELRGQEENVEALWTHFAVADSTAPEDIEFTNLQCDRFEAVARKCREAGLNFRLHAANSGAVLRHPRAHYDLVRPGLMIYGMEPSGEESLTPELRQAMTLKSALSAVKYLEKGDTISYARWYEVPDRRRIGVVPVGYGDGYMVAVSNKIDVLVRGKRVPVRGRVCMDQFMVDLSEVPEARLGDEVVIYGYQGGERLPIEEAARIGGTIPYEITCSLTPRIPRVYRNE